MPDSQISILSSDFYVKFEPSPHPQHPSHNMNAPNYEPTMSKLDLQFCSHSTAQTAHFKDGY